MITTGQVAWCETWLLTRTHQKPGETAAAARSHHEHVGAVRGIDEFFRRIPRDHGDGDLGYRPADFARDLAHELPSGRPRELR